MISTVKIFSTWNEKSIVEIIMGVSMDMSMIIVTLSTVVTIVVTIAVSVVHVMMMSLEIINIIIMVINILNIWSILNTDIALYIHNDVISVVIDIGDFVIFAAHIEMALVMRVRLNRGENGLGIRVRKR
jgi:hypothetical protein